MHSDVGGGNKNIGLSSIALDWMFAHAKRAGVKLDPEVVKKNRARMKPAVIITLGKDSVGKERPRVVRAADPVHQSVKFRPGSISNVNSFASESMTPPSSTRHTRRSRRINGLMRGRQISGSASMRRTASNSESPVRAVTGSALER